VCCSDAQANAIGKNAKTVREYLEKNYNEKVVKSQEETIKLAVKALLEVVQSGSQSIEMAVLEKGKRLKFLSHDEIDSYVKMIEADKEEELKKKKQKKETPSS
jgi:20S proteasome subunit alpha 4